MKIDILPFKTIQVNEGYVLVSPFASNYFCCDEALYQRIVQGSLDEDIALKLYQLGFCKINDEVALVQKKTNSIRPLFFLIDVTTRCNLRCVYCFRKLSNQVISSEVLSDILIYIEDYCKQNNVHEITIQPWGGEPLLAFDRIHQIHEFFQNSPIQCQLTFQSNGTKIDKEMANSLKKMSCNIGISLDGTEEIHNTTRPLAGGQNSFKWVINGITNLRQAGHETNGTILVLTKRNITFIEQIMDFYAKELGFTSMKINYVIDNDNISDAGLCLTPEEYAEAQLTALNKMIKLHEQGFRLIEENVVLKGRNILFGTSNDICRSSGCQGGYRMIAFDMIGNIYPCDMTDEPEMVMGNIYSNISLTEVIQGAIQTHNFFNHHTNSDCLSCSWRSYCMGGCKSSRFYSHFSFDGRDVFECQSNRTLYPYLLKSLSASPELIELFE